MARSYKRDARGRFAGGGYSGQTGGRGARLTAKGQRAGGGTKMTAGRVGGTIGKPKGLKPGALKVKAGSKSPPPLASGPGARKRASETQEAFAKRKLAATQSKLWDKKGRLDMVESSLRRRRGKLDPDARRAASLQQRKLRKSVDKLKQAEQSYQSTVNVRAAQRGMMMAYRNRGKAPDNTRTRLNTVRTLGNRINYLKKEGATPDDRGLQAIQRRRNAVAMSLAGTGVKVPLRSRSDAAKAQRRRGRDTLERARISNQTATDMSGRVTVHMQGGYGVKKNARPTPVNNGSVMNPVRMGRVAVKIPTTASDGRRIVARKIGVQGDLFGRGKTVKSYRGVRPKGVTAKGGRVY